MNRVGPGEMDVYQPMPLVSYNNFITIAGLLEFILAPVHLKVEPGLLLVAIMAMKSWLAVHYPGQMNSCAHDKKLITMIISYYLYLYILPGTFSVVHTASSAVKSYLQYIARDFADLLFGENPIEDDNEEVEDTEESIAFKQNTAQKQQEFLSGLAHNQIDIDLTSSVDDILQDLSHAFLHMNLPIVSLEFYRRDENNNRIKILTAFMIQQHPSSSGEPEYVVLMGVQQVMLTIRHSQLRHFLAVHLLVFIQNILDILEEQKRETVLRAQQQSSEAVSSQEDTVTQVLEVSGIALALTTVMGVFGTVLDFLWRRQLDQAMVGRVVASGSAWLLLQWFNRHRKR